jgi:hypothetical protein
MMSRIQQMIYKFLYQISNLNIFETNVAYESGNQMDAFDEKV